MVACAGLPSTLTNIQDLPDIRPSLSRFIQWGGSETGNFWPAGSGLFWKRVPNPDLDPNDYISDPHHCTGAKRPKVEIPIGPRPLSNQKYLILAPPGRLWPPVEKKTYSTPDSRSLLLMSYCREPYITVVEVDQQISWYTRIRNVQEVLTNLCRTLLYKMTQDYFDI